MFLSRTETDAFFDDCAPDERGLVHQHHIDELFRTFCDDRSPGAGRDKKVDDGRWYLPGNRRYVPEPVVQTSYDRVAFANMVDAWHIPSSKGDPNKLDEKSKQYESALPMGRRLRAHWSMEGPQSTFIMLVVALQTALGVWLLVKQLKDHEKLDLLGWGLVVAKTSAGVLYPTLALLILSSSRSLGTWLRKSPILSKFVNWDLSQEFHIQMAITAFVFTTLHVIGHLGGTFVHLARSQPGRAAVVLNNFKSIDPSYADVIRSLPGITGLLAVAILVAIGLCSHPRIRRKHFELFQATHLLVYPLIGLLMAHGTRGWLQAPMLGYWLALPTLILLGERLVRVFHYVVPVHATIVPQQSDVVMLILKRARPWKIQPGQYILLCVPSISLLQWHPFTVSSFSDCEIRVHIRTTSGRWTSKIKTTDFSKVMVDGPFGSPAEKFYGYDRTVVIGTGVRIVLCSSRRARSLILYRLASHRTLASCPTNPWATTVLVARASWPARAGPSTCTGSHARPLYFPGSRPCSTRSPPWILASESTRT